jgi:hypothetical protein
MRLIILLLTLVGCGGYRFTHQENPLSQYGIQSLSVPMFYNYSNMPEISGELTRETYRLLTSFSGLKLNSGYNPNADAVLIGIIRSPEKISETLRPGNLRVAKEQTPSAIGNQRENFYIPGTTDMTLSLHVILIKKPTEEELALLRSGIGSQIQSFSKIILNERIPLNIQYTREILDNDSRGGVQVVATQNAGVQRKTIRSLAEQAAISVRDMILYAF